MNQLLRILKPTPLAVLLMILALALIGIVGNSRTLYGLSGKGEYTEGEITVGIGSPIKIITAGDSWRAQIRWPLLLAQLTILYLVVNRIAIDVIRLTRFHHPATTYGTVALLLLALAFLLAISFSKDRRGYWLAKPKLLPEADLIATVQGVCAFKTELEAPYKPVLVSDTNHTLTAWLEFGSYYAGDVSGRILVPLKNRKLLPAEFSTNLALLPQLSSIITNSGALVNPERGYDSFAKMRGVVVDATDKAGNRCLLIGMVAGQVSFNQYPYYELFFQEDRAAQAWKGVHGQHYFYEAPGKELPGWPAIWIGLSVIFLPVGLVIFTVRRLMVRRRSVARV